jgi:hypothetical protein
MPSSATFRRRPAPLFSRRRARGLRSGMGGDRGGLRAMAALPVAFAAVSDVAAIKADEAGRRYRPHGGPRSRITVFSD